MMKEIRFGWMERRPYYQYIGTTCLFDTCTVRANIILLHLSFHLFFYSSKNEKVIVVVIILSS